MPFRASRRRNRCTRRVAAHFVSLAVLVFGGCGDNRPESATQTEGLWVEVAPAGAGFGVEFPAAPNEEVLGNEGQTAVIGGRRYVLDRDGANAAYRVESLDYDPKLIALLRQASGGGMQQLVVAAAKKIVADVGGALASEAPIMLHDPPGKDITMELQGGGRARARVYLVGSRLYRLVVSQQGAELAVADVERFFDSFALRD